MELLQIATAFLLQPATLFLANFDRYYKVRWIYYKAWWLLQIATIQYLFHYPIIIIKDKKTKNLPTSHFSPLHCRLHEQANASFSLSNKQGTSVEAFSHQTTLQKIAFYMGEQKLFSIDFLQLFTLANVLGQKRSTSCDPCSTYWSLKMLFKPQCKSHLCKIYTLNLETKIQFP